MALNLSGPLTLVVLYANRIWTHMRIKGGVVVAMVFILWTGCFQFLDNVGSGL